MKKLTISLLILIVILIGCKQETTPTITIEYTEGKDVGYIQKDFNFPVKRYCQILTLRDDPELMKEYAEWHSKVWPEVLDGIKKVGILDHEIYIHGNTVFMILVTPVDFDFDTQMAKLALMPRQAEWEEFMSKFQDSSPDASSAEKWTRMERIFKLK